MNDSYLEIKDLCVTIGSNSILSGISIDVTKGQALGIIGPNGSGKTTLFNALNGFMPASKGRVIFSGIDISIKPPHQRALLGIARVFQSSGIFRDMSLEENLIVALESRSTISDSVSQWGKVRKGIQNLALQYLKDVNLQDKAADKASSLSGGQLRLLEITRAIAFGAELFLLDEPTAGVSPRMKDEVIAQVSKLKESGKTVLIIEHDINLIQRICDRIVVLDAGKVVMDGSPREIRESPALQEIYFGSNV